MLGNTKSLRKSLFKNSASFSFFPINVQLLLEGVLTQYFVKLAAFDILERKKKLSKELSRKINPNDFYWSPIRLMDFNLKFFVTRLFDHLLLLLVEYKEYLKRQSFTQVFLITETQI